MPELIDKRKCPIAFYRLDHENWRYFGRSKELILGREEMPKKKKVK